MATLDKENVEASVTGKEFITPHYIRLYLTGDVEQFKHTTIGDNNKILVPPVGLMKYIFRALMMLNKNGFILQKNLHLP